MPAIECVLFAKEPPQADDGNMDELSASSASIASEPMPMESASIASTSSFTSNIVEEPPIKKKACTESIGNKVDSSISTFFGHIGSFVSNNPKLTIILALLITAGCSIPGLMKLSPEFRPEKLWLPQNTQAEYEEARFLSFFPPTSRLQHVVVSNNVGAAADNGGGDDSSRNALTKDNLITAMKMHQQIQNDVSTYDGVDYTFPDLCTSAGGSCTSFFDTNPVCSCLVLSILKVWSYDLERLENDDNVMATLNTYGSKEEDYESVLGLPVFDSSGTLVGAEAFTLSYFLDDRSYVENGIKKDPINMEWEKNIFLANVQATQEENEGIDFVYFSARSFDDEFGGEIEGDLIYVSVSYIVAFLFVGMTLGSKGCGRGSRWALSQSVMALVAFATLAGFGVASLTGLLYSPMHSVLPFVLLGIGVDDAFVIANAFDREREGIPRASEDNESIIKRGSRALARAGASITVTSLTDLVAFAISSSSAIPALASFCAYASYCIFFLWTLAATFFVSCMVIDEKRQRDNRMDCLVCLTRNEDKVDAVEEEDTGSKEGSISRYFRNYHAPTILSKHGKAITLLFFSCLLAFGVYGATLLPVEDSTRNFIPVNSYIRPFFSSMDTFFPSAGSELYITFEGGSEIYRSRDALANLDTRLSNLSEVPPYISGSNYQNVMAGFKTYLDSGVDRVRLGEDGWPDTYEAFVVTLKRFVDFMGPGARYAQDVSFSSDGENFEAFRVKAEYVRLTKTYRGEVLDDASLQIAAMDATRDLVNSWVDLPASFPYCMTYVVIEGFKLISTELYRNVGLAIAAVGVIVLVTVANIVTTLLITLNVALCIIEILGAMWALGLVIDSISVVNIVLAVGLSIDYSAHIGHCFMVKGGDNKDVRATETLADIGASVLNGALSTFLAVAVLLFSSSYVFKTLAIQFALTVALGMMHGLVLLPVLLSIFGPKPFSSAEPIKKDGIDKVGTVRNHVSMKQDEDSASTGSDEDSSIIWEEEHDEEEEEAAPEGEAATMKEQYDTSYSIQVNRKCHIIEQNS